MSIVAYARVKTDREGKIYNIDEITNVNVPDCYSLDNIGEKIIDTVIDEKDSDLLVTLDFSESKEGITISKVIVLRTNYKELFKEKLIEMDAQITSFRKFNEESGNSHELYYIHQIEDDIEALQELYEVYQDVYNENMDLKNV